MYPGIGEGFKVGVIHFDIRLLVESIGVGSARAAGPVIGGAGESVI